MFKTLEDINLRPKVFGAYTAESLWSDSYRAKQMLAFHLNEHIDVSSRNYDFIEASVQWIKNEFALGSDSRICDFGCGPGHYTSRFARLGANVTGIDCSASSIEYAKKKASELGLNIEYIKANYLDVDLPRQYDLITMIMCDFCALSPTQRKSLLAKFSELLSSVGKLVMDVYSTNSFAEKEEFARYDRNYLNHFWYQEDYYCFSNTFKYEKEKVILDMYSLFTQSDKSEVVYNWLQCFNLETLTQELAGAGLKVQAVYSDVCGNEYNSNHTEFAVVVERDT